MQIAEVVEMLTLQLGDGEAVLDAKLVLQHRFFAGMSPEKIRGMLAPAFVQEKKHNHKPRVTYI